MAATLLSVAGCAPGPGGGPHTAMRDSAGVIIVTSDLVHVIARDPPVCSLSTEPTVTIGAATGAPEYQFYRVFGAITLSDGTIVVLNQGSSQLRFFDGKGRFRHQTGSHGDGPGEFRNAFGLWVLPGDTIWAGDYGAWRFQVFDRTGGWVRTVRPATPYPASPDITVVLRSGLFVLGDFKSRWQSRPGYHPAQIDLLLHAKNGALIDTLMTLGYGVWGMATPAFAFHRLFESFAMAAGSGDQLVVGQGGSPEVSVFRVTGESVRLDRIIRFTISDRTVTAQDIAAERRRVIGTYFELEARRAEIPTAAEVPAFEGLRMGRDGRIWIKEYARDRSRRQYTWLSFGPDGAFECRLELPPFRQIFEIGADYILVLNVDDLGVERVQRYELVVH